MLLIHSNKILKKLRSRFWNHWKKALFSWLIIFIIVLAIYIRLVKIENCYQMGYIMLPKGTIYRWIIWMSQLFIQQVLISMGLTKPLYQNIGTSLRLMFSILFRVTKFSLHWWNSFQSDFIITSWIGYQFQEASQLSYLWAMD